MDGQDREILLRIEDKLDRLLSQVSAEGSTISPSAPRIESTSKPGPALPAVLETSRLFGRSGTSLEEAEASQDAPNKGESKPVQASSDDETPPPSRLIRSGNEKKEKSTERTPAKDIERVWETYVTTMKPRSRSLDAETRRIIREALKVATVDECVQAVIGCSLSTHHMGMNDRRKKYNKITHILKGKRGIRTTREQIDMMLDYAEHSNANVPSGTPARIQRAVDLIVSAKNNPHDAFLQERAAEAQGWADREGVEIVFEMSVDGRYEGYANS